MKLLLPVWLGAILFFAGCTTTREIGSRGDATLYESKSCWPMVYPFSITFEQVPLDRPGSYHFSVVNLREGSMSRFDLRVHSPQPLVDPSGAHVNKDPLPSAGFASCAVRLRIADASGTTFLAETLRFGDKTWFIESKQRRNYRVSYPTGPKYPNFPAGNFSVSVDVIAPSGTGGDYLTIQGMGFPRFPATDPTTANMTADSTASRRESP